MFISPNLERPRLSTEIAVAALRAAGEATRLRILALLSRGELAVGELAQALGQSQPRVSRHLKLLTEAGLVERSPEGAWVYYRLGPMGGVRALADHIAALIDWDDAALQRDAARLAEIRAARDEAAKAYFETNASNWAQVRTLHLPDADIEAAMLDAAGPGPFQLLIDAGVGAGRMIEVFADRCARAEGFDTSAKMLSLARAALGKFTDSRATVRFGDVYAPPFPPGCADLVTLHQVLHYLSDPGQAIAETAAMLAPGGRLLICDFAPHDVEFLRERHAHRRLGFSDAEIQGWCAAAGAPVSRTLTLAPTSADKNALTVKIWIADRPAIAGDTP